MAATTASPEAHDPHAYRSPTVVLAPGVLFRAGQWLTIGSLVVVAAIALVQLLGTLSYDLCLSRGEAPYVCAMRQPPVTMSDFGVPLWLQEAWLEVPSWVSLLVLFADVVAAFFLVRPRTVHVDPVTRTLVTRERALFRRAAIRRLPLDEAIVLCVKEGASYAVVVVTGDGVRHDVTGPRLGRRRQERVAQAIEAAISRGV